jgi:hypothetical protein
VKTHAVVITPEAFEQLRAIERYITGMSGYPVIAERYVDALMLFCESLDTFT